MHHNVDIESLAIVYMVSCILLLFCVTAMIKLFAERAEQRKEVARLRADIRLLLTGLFLDEPERASSRIDTLVNAHVPFITNPEHKARRINKIVDYHSPKSRRELPNTNQP